MRARTIRDACVTTVLAGLLAGTVAGCGSDDSDGSGSTPAAQVPALQTRLDAVDRAVSAGHAAAVRRAVGRLERAADDAERSGDLAQDDAAAIVSAGDALLAALPARPHRPTTSSTPSPTPTPSPSSEVTEEAPEPPGHEKGPKPPKPAKPAKPPHGHGHGHGPEHGHGPGHER